MIHRGGRVQGVAESSEKYLHAEEGEQEEQEDDLVGVTFSAKY